MAKRLPEHIVIGVIERAHGVTGQVKVKPITHTPSRFSKLSSVLIEYRSGQHDKLEIKTAAVKPNGVYIQFHGVDSRELAQQYHGAYICIEREQALPLDEDEFYHFNAIGAQLTTTDGEELGRVQEVLDMPANAVFVVENEGRELLIPVIRDVIVSMDLKKGEIVINPIEGLL